MTHPGKNSKVDVLGKYVVEPLVYTTATVGTGLNPGIMRLWNVVDAITAGYSIAI